MKRNEGRSITIQCCQGGRLFVQKGNETSKPFPMNDVRITMSIDKKGFQDDEHNLLNLMLLNSDPELIQTWGQV